LSKTAVLKRSRLIIKVGRMTRGANFLVYSLHLRTHFIGRQDALTGWRSGVDPTTARMTMTTPSIDEIGRVESSLRSARSAQANGRARQENPSKLAVCSSLTFLIQTDAGDTPVGGDSSTLTVGFLSVKGEGAVSKAPPRGDPSRRCAAASLKLKSSPR